jgi:hypothetical protein
MSWGEVVAQDEITPPFGEQKSREKCCSCTAKSRGEKKASSRVVVVGETEFSNKMKFRVLWKTNRLREALSSQSQISWGKKVSSCVVGAGEAEFSNSMKFRRLWETKAAQKVLASCGGLARGAEVVR